jgi:hypothetical protein
MNWTPAAGNGFGINHGKGLDKCERIVENMVDYLNAAKGRPPDGKVQDQG